ncbi:MAG: acetyl-CoA carboxylase biotin carboxyl carrier protein [Clostridiaceae bacterium]|nr:acetyl-CoA carboxylase biotin carboxyl carrier protein [Clostridiaceae bacterium]
MNESNIRKYAALMKELDLTGLEVDEKNSIMRIERTPSVPAIGNPPPAAPVPSSSKEETADYISISSPMVGVFYASPSENADPFVRAGDKIQKGSTLCIIEAMKLMNELTAEENCTIVEICVQNGQIVDYGCELFRIKR